MTAPLVLVTGFEPFGDHAVNPSHDVIRRLEGWRADVQGVVLPVEFGRCVERLDEALQRLKPDTVIALGVGPTRTDLSIERIAINLDDARIPDNAGRQPLDTPVLPGAPAAYFSTLPVKAIVAALCEAGLPASLSLTAGSYVCNHLFFALAHRVASAAGPRRAGFIHLPSAATLPLERMVAGVQIAVETCLHTGDDLQSAGGRID
jgi:pyroglutamyl-peptidase